jgi:hypothetical protein
LDIKENMIILIRNIQLKLSRGMDLILENPQENSVKIVGMVNNEDTSKLRKLRINKKLEFSSFIDLTKSVVVRNLNKYLITIKKVFKIYSVIENQTSYSSLNEINGFPKMKLTMKCLADDGSLEALIYLENYNVINLFKWDKKVLEV